MGAVLTWVDFVLPPALLIIVLLFSPLPAKIISVVAGRQSTKRGKSGEILAHDGTAAAPEAIDDDQAAGFIVPAQIHHARMLPSDAKHQFRYPGLYLAFELHELEAGHLDCAPGFNWNGLHSRHNAIHRAQLERRRGGRRDFALTKLDPAGFGRKTFPEVSSELSSIIAGSMLLKLLFELRHRKYIEKGPQDVDLSSLIEGAEQPWNAQLGEVWAIAMPTLLGLGGFNPLTIYYVYRASKEDGKRGSLWLAVLEVHNTFNERHIYVCEVDKPSAMQVAAIDTSKGALKAPSVAVHRGYEYFWEFPRTFHVSPFNDRSGCYQLYLNDLWRDGIMLPTIDVRLLLMAPDEKDEAAPLQKKLMATLTSSQATSPTLKTSRSACKLSALNVFTKIAAQPLDLFLPVARIMWEASKLHWKKKLPVYMRPEPHGAPGTPSDDKTAAQAYDGVGWPLALNAVGRPRVAAPSIAPEDELKETAAKSSKGEASGGIYWNDESFVESTCRLAIFKLFEVLTKDGPVKSIVVRSRNAEQSDVLFRDGKLTDLRKEGSSVQAKAGSDTDAPHELTFYTLSSAMYVDLCMFPPQLAHLIGSRAERLWGVSSLETYDQTLSSGTATVTRLGLKARLYSYLARRIRTSYVLWSLGKAALASSQESKRTTRDLVQMAATQSHPLDSLANRRGQVTSGYSLRLLIALLLHVVILYVMAVVSSLLRVRYVRTPWAAVGDAHDILLSRHSSPDNARM